MAGLEEAALRQGEELAGGGMGAVCDVLDGQIVGEIGVVCAWEMALRKVLSTKFTAPPSTSRPSPKGKVQPFLRSVRSPVVRARCVLIVGMWNTDGRGAVR